MNWLYVAATACFSGGIGILIGERLAWGDSADILDILEDNSETIQRATEILEERRTLVEEADHEMRGKLDELVTHYGYNRHRRDEEAPVETEEELDEPVEEFAHPDATSAKDVRYPWLISEEEFFENGEDFSTSTLHYYECGTVADEGDHIVDDLDEMVGVYNLDKFGDEHVIYVKSYGYQALYEVLLQENTYAQVVAGFIEQASEKSIVRKFRAYE